MTYSLEEHAAGSITDSSSDRVVRVTWLAKCDFTSGTKRYWIGGFGTRNWGGFDWEGLGEIVNITEVEAPVGDATTALTLTFSGAAAVVMTRAQGATSEWKSKKITVYDAYFVENEVLDLGPRVIWLGAMDRMTVEDRADKEGRQRKVDIECIDRRSRRNKAAYATWTGPDQKRRYADDTGFDFIPYNKQMNVF